MDRQQRNMWWHLQAVLFPPVSLVGFIFETLPLRLALWGSIELQNSIRTRYSWQASSFPCGAPDDRASISGASYIVDQQTFYLHFSDAFIDKHVGDFAALFLRSLIDEADESHVCRTGLSIGYARRARRCRVVSRPLVACPGERGGCRREWQMAHAGLRTGCGSGRETLAFVLADVVRSNDVG